MYTPITTRATPNAPVRLRSNSAAIPNLSIEPTEDWQRRLLVDIQEKHKASVKSLQEVRNSALKLDQDDASRDYHLRMYGDAMEGVRVRVEEEYFGQVRNALGENDDLPISSEEKQRCIYEEFQQEISSRSTSGWASPSVSEASDSAGDPIQYEANEEAPSNPLRRNEETSKNDVPRRSGSSLSRGSAEKNKRRRKVPSPEIVVEGVASELEELRRQEEEMEAKREAIAKRKAELLRPGPRGIQGVKRAGEKDTNTREAPEKRTKAQKIQSKPVEGPPKMESRDAPARLAEPIEDPKLKKFQRAQQQAAVLDKLRQTKAKQDRSTDGHETFPGDVPTSSSQSPSAVSTPKNLAGFTIFKDSRKPGEQLAVESTFPTSRPLAPKEKKHRPAVTIEEVSDPEAPGNKANVVKSRPLGRETKQTQKEQDQTATQHSAETQKEVDRKLPKEVQAAEVVHGKNEVGAEEKDDRSLPIDFEEFVADNPKLAKFLREQQEAAQAMLGLENTRKSSRSSMEKSRPGRVPANQARVPAIPSQQHQRAFLPPALAPTRSDRIPSHVAPSSGPVSGSQKSGPHGERKKFKGKQREDAAGVHRDEDKLMGAFISTMLDVGGKDGLHATSTADGMFGALQGTLGKGG